jgi:hypothetical protein
MKIRTDFVTNFSSTNFFFIFKGPRCIRPLEAAIRNHKKPFNLCYLDWEKVGYSCTHEDIISDIKSVIKSSLGKDEWDSVKVVSIDKAIKEVDKYIDTEEKSLTDPTYNEESKKWMRKIIKILESKKMKFQKAKDQGFENVFEMGWGDNHGQISGGNTGMAMDYEGRRIKINEDDLIVFTEQNR